MDSHLGFVPFTRALVSTYDKTGLVPLCKALVAANVEIISTGNTARFLQENNIPVVDVETITGFPEILDGRVKTLHPHVFAGILARRNMNSHIETLKVLEIDPIDIVVVNLYPFEKIMNAPGATLADCIENIDIGGPTLLRAAAKNFDHVVALSDPSQYEAFINNLVTKLGSSLDERRDLAGFAFSKTAAYDQAISAWFSRKHLRYGENPHQKAAVIASGHGDVPLARAFSLQGKELSYNNLLDANAAISTLRWLVSDQKCCGAVIVKHGNPCGAALGTTSHDAIVKAFASDPLSAFGGIVATSQTVDEQVAQELKNRFVELVIAPAFAPEARAILEVKKDLRLIEMPTLLSAPWAKESVRSILGGYLIQDVDIPSPDKEQWQVVSAKQPTGTQETDMRLANSLVATCHSNAIAVVRNGQLIGVGAGQTSRVDAVKIAIAKAREHGHDLQGAVLASDAFFPFTDSLIMAQEAGIACIVAPSGSKKDADVISKANDLGLSLTFTALRHFRH